MNTEIPAHFHKTDRISEVDLVPDATVYDGLPVTAEEGRFAVRLNGLTYELYRFLDGAWRLLSQEGAPPPSPDLVRWIPAGVGVATDFGVAFGNQPAAELPAGALGEWLAPCVSPPGATSIASVTVYYIREQVGDIYVRFRFYTNRTDADGITQVNDTSHNYTVYTSAIVSATLKRIVVPSSAYNAITLQGDELVSIHIERDGTDSSDTYGDVWRVVLVRIEFAI